MDECIKRHRKALDELEIQAAIHEAMTGHDEYIELNQDWKIRASSYIAHIRDIVAKATINEPIRERIFKCLNTLQAEIDRNRTRVESLTEVFLSITEAMSKGSKHLEGAVKLIERLAGALSGARTAQVEHEAQQQLPAPDHLGLPEPTDVTASRS